MPDSMLPNAGGPGNIDEKELRKKVEGWGKLPEKERTEAMYGYVRTLPSGIRETVEKYIIKIAAEGNR